MGRLAPQLAVTFCLPHTAIMATITDKNAQESASDTPPSLEKGTADRRPSAGDGYVPANLREEDFRTRNGLLGCHHPDQHLRHPRLCRGRVLEFLLQTGRCRYLHDCCHHPHLWWWPI